MALVTLDEFLNEELPDARERIIKDPRRVAFGDDYSENCHFTRITFTSEDFGDREVKRLPKIILVNKGYFSECPKDVAKIYRCAVALRKACGSSFQGFYNLEFEAARKLELLLMDNLLLVPLYKKFLRSLFAPYGFLPESRHYGWPGTLRSMDFVAESVLIGGEIYRYNGYYGCNSFLRMYPNFFKEYRSVVLEPEFIKDMEEANEN